MDKHSTKNEDCHDNSNLGNSPGKVIHVALPGEHELEWLA